jgi:hypothetical protein
MTGEGEVNLQTTPQQLVTFCFLWQTPYWLATVLFVLFVLGCYRLGRRKGSSRLVARALGRRRENEEVGEKRSWSQD